MTTPNISAAGRVVEIALDEGNLWALMRNGRYWKLRRNGATKLWKRSPERFSIPVKAGLKSCARIEETDSVTFMGDGGDFVISRDDPNAVLKK